MANKNWSDLIRDYKMLMIIVIVGFFLIEIEIFAVAVMKSGRQSWMNVLDDSGEVIYQVKGSTLTNFNKYYFENTFGSIDDYQVKLVSKDVPFPFRAWLASAIGIPVGLVLLLAFVLRSVMVLLYGKKSGADYDEAQQKLFEEDENESYGEDGKSEEESEIEDGAKPDGEGKKKRRWTKSKARRSGQTQVGVTGSAETVLNQLSRLNIFIIGFLILSAVLLYIVIPDLLTFLAKVGIETILNFKWFFLAVLIAVFLLFAWFMYMKYQLARKSLDAQTEIRKYEIKMEYARYDNALPPPDNYKEKEPAMIEYSDVEYEERGKKKNP
ncbi:conserved membrane hypothetical protein [Desulfamplus magnetovallimortis]|uniref:Uncharacterized protein n=1 Tax=Desulfamplus magnetovallimortis TaxID=1246637 RepID=A0A1W1H814_9BACT|nr:hypothetical protein [Desulfamplus magnetovallimortis]SLM28576.1 conserved membrane hypothetical protein [Desulfamplus magnetovallimortis]